MREQLHELPFLPPDFHRWLKGRTVSATFCNQRLAVHIQVTLCRRETLQLFTRLQNEVPHKRLNASQCAIAHWLFPSIFPSVSALCTTWRHWSYLRWWRQFTSTGHTSTVALRAQSKHMQRQKQAANSRGKNILINMTTHVLQKREITTHGNWKFSPITAQQKCFQRTRQENGDERGCDLLFKGLLKLKVLNVWFVPAGSSLLFLLKLQFLNISIDGDKQRLLQVINEDFMVSHAACAQVWDRVEAWGQNSWNTELICTETIPSCARLMEAKLIIVLYLISL